VCWWLSRCWRAPHNFGQNCRGRSEVLGLTVRNFLAPFQRLPDDFVFVRAGELLQKSLATFLINERSEPTALRTAPGVRLDRKVAVINAALKRWRIPQYFYRTKHATRQQTSQGLSVWEIKRSRDFRAIRKNFSFSSWQRRECSSDAGAAKDQAEGQRVDALGRQSLENCE